MNRKLFFLFVLCLLGSPLRAQFTHRSQTPTPIVAVDTVALISSIKPPRFSVYSDAYDQYLRRLRRQQRNSMIFQPTLSFAQASFTNWQKGGDNSFSALAAINFEHNYKAPVFSVRTVFDTKFGLLRTQQQTRKNIDYFDLSTTASWNITERWKLSTTMTWRSQYTRTYDYPADAPRVWKSTFMAPGTVNLSGGFTYESASKKLNVLLSPIAGKMTFVLNDSLARLGGLGINAGERFRAELGMLGRLIYKENMAKDRIVLSTKFESFWNYKRIPTVNWDLNLTFKVTDLFSATVYGQLLFDDQIQTPRVERFEQTQPGRSAPKWRYVQFYENVGFTLSYKIASKPRKPIIESTIAQSRLKYKQ